MTVTIRTSGLPADFRVLPHVQLFADAGAVASGVDSWGTYQGHEPNAAQAVDCFVSPNDPEPGYKLCLFAGTAPWGTAGPPGPNFARYGIDYVIFRQHIYNPKISDDWRLMADRGGVTQNHFDHVHVSFLADAPINHEGADMLTDDQAQQLKDAHDAIGRIEALLGPDNAPLHAALARLDQSGIEQDPGRLEALAADVAAIKKKLGA